MLIGSASWPFLQLLDLRHGHTWRPSNLRRICATTPEQAVRNVVEGCVSYKTDSRFALVAAQPNARTRAVQLYHGVDEVHDEHVVLRPVQIVTSLVRKVISLPLCGRLHRTRSQPRLPALSQGFGQPQSAEEGIRAPTLRTSSDPPSPHITLTCQIIQCCPASKGSVPLIHMERPCAVCPSD